MMTSRFYRKILKLKKMVYPKMNHSIRSGIVKTLKLKKNIIDNSILGLEVK